LSMSFSPTPRGTGHKTFTCVLVGILLILAPGAICHAQVRYIPAPNEAPTLVPVGADGKPYVRLSATPVTYQLVGPGTLTGYARVHFAEGETEPKPGRVILLGIVGTTAVNELTFKPSRSTLYTDARPGQPSGGQKLEWEIPAGEHTLVFNGDSADGSEIFLLLYYAGPEQAAGSVSRLEAQVAKKPEAKPQRYSVRGLFGLDLIYDSNFLGLSDDYIDDWRTGLYPEEFKNRTVDDFIVSPSLDIEVRRQYIGLGQTRLRGRATMWYYSANHIKHNQQYDFFLRQYLGRGKNLELYYSYAPEQYIRMLSDRPPFTPGEDPSVYKEFRFTKNVLGMAYRHRASRTISLKLVIEKNLRYYNRPFIENDINATEVRGTLYWNALGNLNFSFDYSYEYAAAKAVDSVLETPETSDDSDGTYERDLYRLGITWRPRFLRPLFNRADLSGLLMLYYFPTEKELFEDPFHSGRKDTVYKISLSFERRLNSRLTVNIAGRYTERTVDSPWPGDITLDKDYDKYRIWLGFAYKL